MAVEVLTRPKLARQAMLLQVAKILYNVAEGLVAVAAGLLAGSVALLGFGIDSGIEVSASAAVLAHLWLNRDADALAWERRVAIFVGLTLLALAAYVAAQAVYDLVSRSEPDASYVGIAVAAVSLIAMPLLARWEHRRAHDIGSRALEAESRETLVCSYLSATLLIGLGANAVFGWWWADPVAALVMVAVIAREGYDAVTRRELCCID